MLGRLATQVSAVLMGKHKPTYNPSDPECGDYVVVINAGDIVYSKKTYEKKVYRWYTGWPGGLKERTLKVVLARSASRIGNGEEKPRDDSLEGSLRHASKEPRRVEWVRSLNSCARSGSRDCVSL